MKLQHPGATLIKQPTVKILHLGMFEIGRPFGKSKFSRVYLVRERKRWFYLCAESLVRRRVEIQSNLRHPGILKLYGHFHDNRRIFPILEFAGQAKYVTQMAEALRFLHGEHVIHRGIKPDNILLGVPVTARSNGWSVHARSCRRKTYCGNLDYLYLPHKTISPKTSDDSYEEKTSGEDIPVLTTRRIVRGDMTVPAFMSTEAKDLIRKRLPLEQVQKHS
ncbi:kinase-like protein [Hypoxylon sp. NC0597]|nr:kinase-like protein [Hypoxylon sp. NC0597]